MKNMLNKVKIGVLALAVVAASGCSHQTWTNVENNTRVPGVINPLFAPVNLVAVAGEAITKPSSPPVDGRIAWCSPDGIAKIIGKKGKETALDWCMKNGYADKVKGVVIE